MHIKNKIINIFKELTQTNCYNNNNNNKQQIILNKQKNKVKTNNKIKISMYQIHNQKRIQIK